MFLLLKLSVWGSGKQYFQSLGRDMSHDPTLDPPMSTGAMAPSLFGQNCRPKIFFCYQKRKLKMAIDSTHEMR